MAVAVLDAARIRAIVERHFRVYENRVERFGDDEAHLFYVIFPSHEFDTRYEAVRSAIRKEDPELLVFLRREAGEDVLFVASRPAAMVKPSRAQAFLLVATLLTTGTAGTMLWYSYASAGDAWTWSTLFTPQNIGWGLATFTLPLIAILGLHEMAHYITARRHGLRATLPYFIPVPPITPMAIGTFGAFIRLKDPVPDRKALFDVGASGPIMGFFAALPIVLVGAFLTTANAMPVPDLDRPELGLQGTVRDEGPGEMVVDLAKPGPQAILINSTSASTWSYTLRVREHGADGTDRTATFTGRIPRGGSDFVALNLSEEARGELTVTWEDGLYSFGDPLLVKGLRKLGFEDNDYLTHPTYVAGWVGLLVTGINLLPAGPLDGGHVARALLGDKMRYAAWASLGLLLVLGLLFTSWVLMTFLLLLMGINHPPPLNDRTPLDGRRKLIGLAVVLILVLTFVPIPLKP